MRRSGFHRLSRPLTLALVVLLLAGVAAASLIWRLEQTDLSSLRAHATIEAANHAKSLERGIDRALSATYSLAAMVRQGNGVVRDFDAVANEMLPFYPGAASLQLAPRGVVRSVVPLAGNEQAIGHDLLQDPARNKAAFLARDTGKLTLDGPFDLLQGGVGAVGRLPVFLDDAGGRSFFWGFTSVLIRFPVVLEATRFIELPEQGLAWELWRSHPDTGKKLIIAASSPVALIDPVEATLQVPNSAWILSVAPVDGWHRSPYIWIRITAGLLFSLLLAYLTKLLADANAHEKKLETLVDERTADLVAREADLNRAQSIARVGSW
mgnify:CR=1 FL=1